MCDCDSLIGKLEETLDAMDGKLVPRHVGNGLYIVEGMGLMCNREFLDEVDRVILEEIKDKKPKTMDEYQKSMNTTCALLDTVDLEELLSRESVENEMEARALMDRLEEILAPEVANYPELEGYLFGYMNDADFIEYIRDRYEGRLADREVTTNYIRII